MMKMKSMLAAMLMIAIVSACGDDDTSLRSEFKFEDEDKVSLKEGNLYLVYEGEDGGGHIYRDYIITDGTYEEGDGWSFSDYDDATYILAVELGVPEEEEVLSDGSYPQYNSFADAPETTNVSWVSFETLDEEIYLATGNSVTNGDAVQISGDFDDGDRMTIRLNGSLVNYGDDNQVAEGKFYFKGEVQDVRLAPARKAAHGGVH